MNVTSYIAQTFLALNINALSHLGYAFQRNYFVFILIGCLILTIFLNLKTQIDLHPTEEENIL